MPHFRQSVNGAVTTIVADEHPTAEVEGEQVRDESWSEVEPATSVEGDDEGHDDGAHDDAGQPGFPPKTDGTNEGAQS